MANSKTVLLHSLVGLASPSPLSKKGELPAACRGLIRILKAAGTAEVAIQKAAGSALKFKEIRRVTVNILQKDYEGAYENNRNETTGKANMLWADQDAEHVINNILAGQADESPTAAPQASGPGPPVEQAANMQVVAVLQANQGTPAPPYEHKKPMG